MNSSKREKAEYLDRLSIETFEILKAKLNEGDGSLSDDFIREIDAFLRFGIIPQVSSLIRGEAFDILYGYVNLHKKEESLCEGGTDIPKTVFLNILLKLLGIKYTICNEESGDINSFEDLMVTVFYGCEYKDFMESKNFFKICRKSLDLATIVAKNKGGEGIVDRADKLLKLYDKDLQLAEVVAGNYGGSNILIGVDELLKLYDESSYLAKAIAGNTMGYRFLVFVDELPQMYKSAKELVDVSLSNEKGYKALKELRSLLSLKK